ncbi:hypothetical protein ACFWPU_07910 [Streptomyces sp. NPDC058471]|uniref:hypothetical protein n=1 Tax=Streptomyces sp. NPDC058471 TaxID=3346516 RepID=UPI0036504168
MTWQNAILITPLTATERLVLEQISLGHDPDMGSAKLNMARSTFHRHSTQIGRKLHVTTPPVKVQMGFVSGQLPLPESVAAPASFDEKERLLWQAHALHSAAGDIATHAGIEQFDLEGDTARLLKKAGAGNVAHLIRLGHAYGVLTCEVVPPPRAA